ncbi:MAG: hypothetical protein ACREPI_02040 [Candidatus Dormibacterales bacterium]
MLGVPVLAALVGAAFSAAVLRQFAARRRPYQAAWGVALAMFAVAAAAEAWGVGAGWSGASYRVYYLFGAILNVGWLAVGTVYVTGARGAGHAAALVMAAVSLGAVAGVLASHTDPALLRAAVPGRGAISAPATFFPLFTNVVGSVILIGGAAWSAWKALRAGAPGGRVVGTALIAAGAFVVAGGHTLAQTRGIYVLQPACEALGIVIMFGGYLAVEAGRLPRLSTRPARGAT